MIFSKRKNILFLCTGNSCRSQMAEGWGRHLRNDNYQFFSAGTKKHGLNPRAIKVMMEEGVDISSHYSKTLNEISSKMDFVITVCSDADGNCPILPGVNIIHHGFDDPPRLAEKLINEEEILNEYRRVRDEIKHMIVNLDQILEKN